MIFKTAARNGYLTFRTGTLGVLNAMFRRPSVFPQKQVKTIVIACQDRLGDAIMSLPAMAAIRTRYPGAEITCFAVEYIAGLIAGLKYIDKVIVLKNRPAADILHAFALRKSRPDLGLDLQTDYTMRNSLLFAAAGVNFSIGYNVNGRGLLYTKSLDTPPHDMPMVDCLLRLSQEADAPDMGRVPELHVSEQAKTNFLNNHGNLFTGTQFLVGIHPGGHYKTQRWPDDRFAATADALIESGAAIMLIGGDRERESINNIRSIMKQQPSVFFPENLDDLITAISMCKVIVCNNSGPLHVAAALGVSTVSTMGPTDVSRWWPLGPNSHVLRKNLPCSSCNSGVCKSGTMECMNAISVDEMVAATLGILNQVDKNS